MATEGRVLVDDHPEGAACLVAPGVAVTARHVIKAALDENDQHRQDRLVTVDFGGGVMWTGTVEKCDRALDVAVLRGAPVTSAGVFGCGTPMQGAAWRVSTRFLDNDPALTGTVTDPARTIRNAQGHEAALVQLHVEEDLGGFNGYSGSPVWTTGTGALDRVAVGVLVEQTLLRVKKQPGHVTPNATNVLWAAPVPAVLTALGLAKEIPLVPVDTLGEVSWPARAGPPAIAAEHQERSSSQRKISGPSSRARSVRWLSITENSRALSWLSTTEPWCQPEPNASIARSQDALSARIFASDITQPGCTA